MALIYRCDRCGNERGVTLYKIKLYLITGTEYADDDLSNERTVSKLDLCTQCANQVLAYANTKVPRIQE